VLEALDEERTDRTIDQAGNKRFLFARAAFALEEATGDLARRVGLFLVVHGQGEEVEARLRRTLADHRGQHCCFAIGGHHGTVSLAGDLARLQDERATAPFDFFASNVKHISFLFRSPAIHAFFHHPAAAAFLPLLTRPDKKEGQTRLRRMRFHRGNPGRKTRHHETEAAGSDAISIRRRTNVSVYKAPKDARPPARFMMNLWAGAVQNRTG